MIHKLVCTELITNIKSKHCFFTLRSITHETFEYNLCKALESNWFLNNKLKLTIFSLDNAVNKIFLFILLTYFISFEYQ